MKSNFQLNLIIILLFTCPFIETGLSQSIEWQGQASSWLTINPSPALTGQIGLRYIPSIFLQKDLNNGYQFNSELSINAYGAGSYIDNRNFDKNGKIKPYRFWFRFTSSQFELRAGLQKINFGSATILRPLMWFDHMDPRDPLQLTDGVYGLLGRYYFLNNANIWIWVLYNNDKTKGWEIYPTEKHKPEIGGRVQFPLWTGEIALTGHHRAVNADGTVQNLDGNTQSVHENRFALDGKWDAGVGIWFEGVLTKSDFKIRALRYTRMLNLGMDYTFDYGNGFHILAEYLRVDISGEIFNSGRPSSLAALTMNYPLTLLDNLSAIFYYDWDNRNAYRFLNWQRTYDRWSFYLMGFWNPKSFQIYQNQADQNLFTDKGFQFMVVFNH